MRVLRMGLLGRLFARFRRKEQVQETEKKEERKSFSSYMRESPKILAYFRRERGISKRELELVLVDNEDRPAYQIAQIAEYLMPDLNLFYIATGRPDAFEDLAEEAMEEYGLLLTLLTDADGQLPGNLVLDTNEWEKHLDIMSSLSYNTMIM